ncbi:MAG: hypothetical protein HY586_06020 [Candidatus Omnitrophica bacterium]|nr:hypothetical protein [Candidatus Omnitrophota bacterium]
MELLIILLVAALVRAPFILLGTNYIDLDEATFGLMAKRILEGEIPLFFTGQSYCGSLAAFVLTPFLALFGHTGFALKLGSLTFFLAFLSVNYALMKRIASRPVAVFTSLFFIVMPPALFQMSLKVWGCHSELWVFYAALLLLLAKYFDGPQHFFSEKILFWIGFFAGAGLWLSELYLLFLIPILLYFFLRFRSHQEESAAGWLYNLFWLKHFRLPGLLRRALIGWHFLLVTIFLMHTAAIFLADSSWMNQPLGAALLKKLGAVPPFQIKMLKKILLMLFAEAGLVTFLHSALFSKLLVLRNGGAVIVGVSIGHLPAILFNLLGGEGLRIFHKSGALAAGEWSARAGALFGTTLPQLILGRTDPAAWCLAGIIFIAVCATVVYFRKDFKILYHPERGRQPSYLCLFFLMAVCIVLGNMLSTLAAMRYVAPVYLALAPILGYFFGQILWRGRLKILSILLSVSILGYFLIRIYHVYEGIPKNHAQNYYEIIDSLEARGIQGGYARRDLSQILTYLSGEKIVFSSYAGTDRYIPHEQFVGTLAEKAYVFEPGDSSDAAFRENETFTGKVRERKEIGSHVVYWVSEETDSIRDNLPYSPKHRKFPIQIYLNQ